MGLDRVVFVHGAGAGAGSQAWPLQAADPDPGWQFLARADEGDDAARDAPRVLDLLRRPAAGTWSRTRTAPTPRSWRPSSSRSWCAPSPCSSPPASTSPGGGLPVQTVVVTAAARALYEEVAMALASLGAVHRTLRGAGHRVQADPRATALLREFWSG